MMQSDQGGPKSIVTVYCGNVMIHGLPDGARLGTEEAICNCLPVDINHLNNG